MTEPQAPVAEPVAPVAPAPPVAPPVEQTPATPPAPTAEEPKFTQAQVDAILKDRLARADKAAAEKLQKEQEAAEAKRLAEQGEFKTIAEKEKARADALEATLKQRDYDSLRTKVAVANKLPAEMAVRLVGDDETALTDDAKRLVALLVPATPVPGASPSPKPSGPVGAMTDDEARARHSRGLYSW